MDHTDDVGVDTAPEAPGQPRTVVADDEIVPTGPGTAQDQAYSVRPAMMASAIAAITPMVGHKARTRGCCRKSLRPDGQKKRGLCMTQC